jgi:hypothetical protein
LEVVELLPTSLGDRWFPQKRLKSTGAGLQRSPNT